MNLSKVYSTQDTFQPEDIISARLVEPPVFNQSIISSRLNDKGFQRQELTAETVRLKAAPEKIEPTVNNGAQIQPTSVPPDKPAQETHQESTTQAQPKKEKIPAPPQPPPGVPHAEVDRLVAEAYEKGITEGLQQAEHDFGSATAALILVCQQLDTLRETVIKNSVGEIQDLVIAIAEKIIRHSVQEQSETIIDTVEEAIQKAVKSGEFYIYVHPDDYTVIAAKADELIAGMNGLNNIVVKKDTTVDRGGCRVESDNCTVDGTITSQLEIVREHLHEQ
ncbi:FliH/SctL family protein [Desulfopila aestuarii]|uniref:Flagellar assembly protein FliH n=1 Tax=Desulfopila aestuarii DSM 18488 TaxID=1121416 RepID=A0A1M7YDK2_9BACT|nr:FliH/SctL family protein [Desulfopila aestuarii]SHO50710.1 flagellar assembly protein FliH [Desulfopila aestuarii DSM 18488]